MKTIYGVKDAMQGTENATVLTADSFTGPMPRDHQIRNSKKMLLYEDTSRQRMREDQQFAADQRLGNRMLSVRRWERVEGWVAKRVARARQR